MYHNDKLYIIHSILYINDGYTVGLICNRTDGCGIQDK